MYPNRFLSYSNSALQFLQLYDGAMPFAHFIKAKFSENKKYGSKDRRWIAHFCYCYFRIAAAAKSLEKEVIIKIGVYLCSHDLSEYQEIYHPNWLDAVDLQARIAIVQQEFANFQLEKIYPLIAEVSTELDKKAFQLSFLKQPNVFLRVRPQQLETVQKKLKKVDWIYHWEKEDCLSIPPNIKIEDYLQLNKEVVVQDFMSQSIAQYFPDEDIKSYYDCCAASGGKAMLFHDYFPDVFLNVSDIRASILNNLKKRFHEAGIHHFTSAVLDMAVPLTQNPKKKFQLVVCDAPCSGSGTWARNPENLVYYKANDLLEKQSLQIRIAENALKYVQKEGYLLYITCSAFEKENEAVAKRILENNLVSLEKSGYLLGYGLSADTMYAALFRLKA